ncbi:MAG TPA: metallopeptidase family protein [Spirochaetota bacterium]
MIVSKDKFEQITTDEIKRLTASLPDDIRLQIENTAIFIEDKADASVEEDDSTDVLGLYEGVPLNQRSFPDSQLPDKIILYRTPLMKSCRTISQLRKEIRITLIHELGHHLGFDEDDLAERGFD